MIERVPHSEPVPEAAWEADAEARRSKNRVEVFNATRPGGLDGWTMDVDEHEAVRQLILDLLTNEAADDGTMLLKDVVAAAQERFGSDPVFPKGRLTNYVRYTKTDMEARCEVERIPRSSPQCICLWRTETH